MNIEIINLQETHKLCVVTTRKGYSYGCTWAIEKDEDGTITSPTIEQVKEAWKEDKSSFSKYNGRYFY